MFAPSCFPALVLQSSSTSLKGMSPENVRVTYDRSRGNIAQHAHECLSRAKAGMLEWYKQTYNEEFNSFALGDRKAAVVEFLFEDSSYRSGAEVLGVAAHIKEHPDYFNLPWWLERGLAEGSFQIQQGGKGAVIRVVDNHSLVTQAVRRGVDMGVRPIVLAGLVRTKPCGDYPQGALVVGVRGGNHFRNILHVPAGALVRDPDFVEGRATIADVFQRTELTEELGVTPEHVVGGVGGIRMHSHHIDKLLDGNAALFAFSCDLNVTAKYCRSVWQENKHPDKQEHKEILFVPYTPSHLGYFVRETFKGKPKNDPQRPDSARVLSFHAALPLALEAGMDMGELQRLCGNELV